MLIQRQIHKENLIKYLKDLLYKLITKLIYKKLSEELKISKKIKLLLSIKEAQELLGKLSMLHCP